MSGPAAQRPGPWQSARRIAPLAWPVFVGQLAVLAFSTVDTVMAGRAGATDLAALAVGSAAYISIFVGLMGVVLAVGPIAGQLYGAGRLAESGGQLVQAAWLALALAVPGCLLLAWPEPFLALAQAPPEVEAKVRGYLAALAWALPPALVFTAFRGFNTAISRPKVVMALQLGALALKVPLNAALVFGIDPGTLPGGLELAPRGAAGCGQVTAVVMWLQLGAAVAVLRRDPHYARFGLRGAPPRPHGRSLAALLRLGVPMGVSIGIEVTGFTFMALFISRLGATPVAGHQIAVNLVSIMFMMPLAVANAASTLVAQRIGAADEGDARRLGWHGLLVGVVIAAFTGGLVYALREPLIGFYTRDARVAAAALPLLAWVGLFHIADAAQTVASFVLRAYRIAVVPVAIYAIAIWGVGLGGGYALAFEGLGPAAMHGAVGFWSAATAGLTLAGTGMSGFLAWRLRSARTGA